MQELNLERFQKKGIDYDIQNPEERWQNLLSDLRYLGNSAWPTLNKGEKWGDWVRADVIKYFAKVVDALRSVYFPVMPPKKGEEKYDSPYWQLYRKSREYMDSDPPPEDKVEEWNEKRENIIEKKVKEAEGGRNAPTFAYITVTGKEPEEWISGRTEHENKEWNGYRVDKNLKVEWLESLNDISGIEVRSSCEGHGDGRFAFVMIRFEDEENDYLGEKLAGFLNRFDDVFSKAEEGNAGRIRICVAGDTWYGEDDWEGFWSNLPGWIEKAVTEVLKEKHENVSEGVFDGKLKEKFLEIQDIGPIVLRPEYISISGSIAFSPGRAPNDIEWIIRDNRFGTGESLKLDRLSRKLFSDLKPDLVLSPEGPNWRYLPVFDLALIPRENPEFRETDKPGFMEKFYENKRDFPPENTNIYEQNNPYMMYPEESRKWKYTAQHHWRGKSVHTDLRFETEDFFIGWTISDQIAGEVEEVPENVPDARKLYSKDIFKIDWEKGEFKKRETEEGDIIDANLRAIQKKKGPLEWLNFEGVTEPGEIGATEEYPGVFHIIDEGRVEWGAQKSWFHEYFLSGGKLQGRIAFRLLEREEEQERRSVLPPGTPEEEPRTSAYWVAMQPEDQTPYVLSKGAIEEGWIPPQGISALPEVIREEVPVNLQYWNHTGDKALELRKKLTEVMDFDFSIINEAEASPEFVLQKKWFRGPVQVRTGPTEEIWYVRIQKDGKFFNLSFQESPLDNEKLAGIEEEPEASGYMEKGREGTEYLEPGTEWNSTKETPAYIRAIDYGEVLILEDSENWKKIEFRGEENKMPELWYFKRENPDSDIWQMSRSQVSKPVEESEYPKTFDVKDKRYILRKTKNGGLVLNRLEKNI